MVNSYKLHDSVGYIHYNGHIMVDQDHFDYTDSVAEMIESQYSDRKKVINPENNADNSVLKSVHNEKRKGFLYANGTTKNMTVRKLLTDIMYFLKDSDGQVLYVLNH